MTQYDDTVLYNLISLCFSWTQYDDTDLYNLIRDIALHEHNMMTGVIMGHPL